MLFMLNIDVLFINYINFNNQINKWVIYVMWCFSMTNWVVFEFVNFDIIIIIEREKLIRIVLFNYHVN